MKRVLNIALLILSFISLAQNAQVVVFKHELRWTDESKFPNYFLYQNIRDSIFKDTKLELMNYLKLTELQLPEKVSYNIINGFGNQKIVLPKSSSGNDYEIGIFSFITRATVGLPMFWKMKIIIKQNNKIIQLKEVNHELEYFNVSGYLTSQQWISPEEFQAVFMRLIKESLGVLPSSSDKIILGSQEIEEKKASSLVLNPSRELIKIDGSWKTANNFSAQLESEKNTGLSFNYKDKFIWEFPLPSLSSITASLFTEITGIDCIYDEKVSYQKKGSLFFSDGQKLGITLKWIQIETKSVKGDEEISQTITNPLVAELYSDKEQIGFFVYSRLEEVKTTDSTEKKFNPFNGYQNKNTLGVEEIHRIEGFLNKVPLYAEYNANKGIVAIHSGKERIAVMVVQNCNPDNRSIGNETLSKSKRMTSISSLKKPSLIDTNSVEWYPIYFPENSSEDSKITAIETLVCLFFGIGNM
jgi:hypothetical protein